MSLATKYRPKTLEEIIGQKSVIKSIREILKRKQTPKTWLFLGPSGCGKTSIARILANHFCGGKAGPSNIVEIDAATNTGAEETRAMTGRANYRAIGSSPIKTYIIDEAHNLSGKALDALLKSTEEPPKHIFWILCSTNATKIPITINTRTVKFTLKPVDELEIYKLLERVSKAEKLDTLPEVLDAIAEGCGGSPRQALSNLEICAHTKSASEAKELLLGGVIQVKEVRDLARLLIGRTPPTWAQVIKVVNLIKNSEAESIRISVTNYIAVVLLNAKSENEATHLLRIIECFSEPYQGSDKMGPLLLSIGAAIGLGG